jgi:hypothetical protein
MRDSIKSQSYVTVAQVPKVSADVQSAKLKQMLGKIKAG